MRLHETEKLVRFNGGCEPLIEVEVDDLIEWISESSDTIKTWVKGPDRPYVMVDPIFLQSKTDRVAKELMNLFPGGADKYRSITVLNAGDSVPAHTDDLAPDWIARIHVPIVTNEGCFFITDDTHYHMKVGMAYKVNPGRHHAVVNGGSETRVHLMFDVFQ